MAPPGKRRPGFSRRAQYGLFLGYVLAAGGVLFAVLLLILVMVDPPGFRWVRGLALDVTSPVSETGSGVVRFFSDTGQGISGYFMAARRNADLKRELARSHQRLVEARAVAFENRRLKGLLKLSGELDNDIAAARIVGSTFDASRRLATLSIGSAHGVEVGQPVRAAEGLIGRVLETGRYAARVLLITDGASSVPVFMVRDGTPALATGRGDGTLELKTLEVGTNPFKRGDVVVTSGVGGIFAPNTPVALVVKTDRETTIARPLAHPARIDFAIVQKIYLPAAGQQLADEPAEPAAAEAAPAAETAP